MPRRKRAATLSLLLAMLIQACTISSSGREATGNRFDKPLDSQQAERLFAQRDAADAAYQAGRWQQASVHYRAVLEQFPDDAYAWFRLGNSLTRQGHYNQAIQAFETSLQVDARQSKPWLNLSTAHLMGAQLATLKAFEVLARDDPARRLVKTRLDALTQLIQ